MFTAAPGVYGAESPVPSALAFPHEVILQLDGALPTDNPQLAGLLELTLARSDVSPGRDSVGRRWRPWVLGYSALFDPFQDDGRKLHSWMDHDGRLVEATESYGRVKLVVEMSIHDDPWVFGGRGNYTLDLHADGNRLSGRFEGTYVRSRAGRAGPAGTFKVHGTVAGRVREQPWPSAVEGHVPLRSAEHPRVIFRKSQVPELRRRMETPEGRAILERLRSLVADEGSMGSWHGYGYGLLYQLTGESKWAEAARRFTEGVIEGKIASPRYGWFTRDGGYMRIAPSAAAVAAAYDLCYEAWSPAFREKIARKIQERICPGMVLEHDLAETDGQLTPRSNHYLLWNGGAGFCITAIKGDPGTDPATIEFADRVFQQRLKRGLEVGFGDHGWFYEGTFCGRFPTIGALNGYLQALRVAEGLDYVSHSSEAQWLTTKWLFEVARVGGEIQCHQRGMYARVAWTKPEGDFAQGFGVMPTAHRAAALHFFNTILEPGTKTYDTSDPRDAVYAFVNWPIGLEPEDPMRALGHVLHDREGRFFVFRSGWTGPDDIVISMRGDTVALGMGGRKSLPGLPLAARITHESHRPEDRTSTVTAELSGVTYAIAADFSGVCGSPALWVHCSRKPGGDTPEPSLPPFLRAASQAKGAPLRVGDADFQVATFQAAAAPTVSVEGEGDEARLVVGRRTVRFDGTQLVLGER